ncbi:hypothetical protein G7Y89_g11008 [Cudoniella acicularis]|uniref:NACHT domain-containing protein n=1 Tax=Cudoniella acicularis TaxID=354080 RepID=A0A8H4W118_9HELO|nr:hypothetical protein G7Y89_g11008 [Cudoniella acicularis]
MRIRFEELIGEEGQASGVRRTGFGTKDEVVPLRRDVLRVAGSLPRKKRRRDLLKLLPSSTFRIAASLFFDKVEIYSTPHRGSTNDLSPLQKYLASIGVYSTPKEISAQIQSSQRDFHELQSRKYINWEISSFFEELPTPGFGLVVDKRLSYFPSSVLVPLRANHMSICKFDTSTESNYQRFLGALKKIISAVIDLTIAHQKILSFLEFDNREERISLASSGTCQWIFTHREYKSWVQNDQSSLLWISGKTGSGKSTLMKYISREITKPASENRPTITASFFFRHSSNTNVPALGGLYQSLLFQILSQVPSTMSDFVDLVSQKRTCYGQLKGSKADFEPWISTNIASIFEETLVSIAKTQRLYLLIDVLDECPDREMHDVIALFSSIDWNSIKTSIKVCMSSRPIRYTGSLSLPPHQKLILEEENLMDIQKYVALQLAHLPKLQLNREELVSGISSKANDSPQRARGQAALIKGGIDFLDYATSYWTEHAKLADVPGLSHEILLEPLGWPSTRVLDHWTSLGQNVHGTSSVTSRKGWTALHVGAAYDLGSLACHLSELLAHNSHSLDLLDSSGRTPLSWAADKGNQSIVQMLIERGASLVARDSEYGNTPLHYVARSRNEKIVELLLQHGANIDDHHGGSTALSLAAAIGHNEVVAMLLASKSDPNLRDIHYGCSPLHLAAGYGQRDVVSLLVKSGADVNAVDQCNNRTPLHYAILGGHHSIVLFCLNAGPLSTKVPMTRALKWHFPSLAKECSPSESSKGENSYGGLQGDNMPDKGSRKGSGKRQSDISNPGPGSGGGGGEGGPGDEPNKNPKLNTCPPTKLELHLSCPYYKYDPGRQHLYTKHLLHICLKCHTILDTARNLEAHYGQATSCPAKLERNYGDGFDDKQHKLLKGRKESRKAEN